MEPGGWPRIVCPSQSSSDRIFATPPNSQFWRGQRIGQSERTYATSKGCTSTTSILIIIILDVRSIQWWSQVKKLEEDDTRMNYISITHTYTMKRRRVTLKEAINLIMDTAKVVRLFLPSSSDSLFLLSSEAKAHTLGLVSWWTVTVILWWQSAIFFKGMSSPSFILYSFHRDHHHHQPIQGSKWGARGKNERKAGIKNGNSTMGKGLEMETIINVIVQFTSLSITCLVGWFKRSSNVDRRIGLAYCWPGVGLSQLLARNPSPTHCYVDVIIIKLLINLQIWSGYPVNSKNKPRFACCRQTSKKNHQRQHQAAHHIKSNHHLHSSLPFSWYECGV